MKKGLNQSIFLYREPMNLEQPVNQRTLLWNPSSGQFGLGDRLRGLASALVLSRLLQSRIAVKWVLNSHCPYQLNEVLDIPQVISVRDDAEFSNIQAGATIHFALNEMPHKVFKMLKSDGLDLFPGGEKEFIHEWRTSLRALKPHPKVELEIAHFWKTSFTARVIGLHLRRTDNLSSTARQISYENVQRYDDSLFRVLQETIRNIKEPCEIFLASDSRRYKEAWTEKIRSLEIPVHSFETNWEAQGQRETDGLSVVKDLFGLSRCTDILTSTFSSMTFVASNMGNAKVTVAEP